MNDILRKVLREGARDLRGLAGEGEDAQRERKEQVLGVVHRVLSIHLGTPPSRFLWQWKDDEKAFHRDGWMTPAEFAEKYVEVPVDDYVCLVPARRPGSPVGRTFTVDYLGNIVDAPPVVYLNVEVDLLKRLAMDTITGGEPVWFGCDVAKQMRGDLGYWDARLYDYDAVYDTAFTLDKSDRLLQQAQLVMHMM